MSTVLTPQQVLERIPQQEPFRFIDEIVKLGDDGIEAAYTWRPDADFYRGHFPGNPVTPGVLIVESIAQLCAFFWSHELGLKEAPGRAMLFGGIDRVKFRDAIVPGQRVVLVTQATEFKVRRSKYETQAIVNGKVVFAGQITGLLGPHMPEIFSFQKD